MKDIRFKRCKYCGNKIGMKQLVKKEYCSEQCYCWANDKCLVCGNKLNNGFCKNCIEKIKFI